MNVYHNCFGTLTRAVACRRWLTAKAVCPHFRSILFFGSDDLSVACLKGILEANVASSVGVVTPPTKKIRRKGIKEQHSLPLLRFAESEGLDIFQPPPVARGSPMKHFQAPLGFDLAVVASFGYFLPPKLLDSFARGAVNVHPSILPRYRGAAPIHHAILNGDDSTGVSIIDLDRKNFDEGKLQR